MWKIITICVMYTTFVLCQSQQCRIFDTRISSFDSQPFPLLERGNSLVLSNDHSTVIIDDGETLSMSCVGNHLEYYGVEYKNKETATLTCRNGTMYSDDWVPGEILDLNWVTCSRPATSVEVITRQLCGENDKGRIVKIYVESKLNENHYLYEACFDDATKQSLYVKYSLKETNYKYFLTKGLGSFKGSTQLFLNVHLKKIYDDGSQREIVKAIVGSNVMDYYRDNTCRNVSLNIHTHYNFDSVQRATFNYINAVPMWKTIITGSWGLSDTALKSYVKNNEITVYSGAWGVNTLKDQNGEQKEIWLEGNGSKRYPSPLWHYRVVYEASTKRGIVFLILNNPFVTMAEAKRLAQMFSCGDVCPDNMNWITTATPVKGYVICCEIDDFRKVVKDLPSFETEGLLSQV